MATTTTNFGFDIPQSSDLVKNGATQIALLGQDIDTFLAGGVGFSAGKNKIINGDFFVNQRAFTSTTSNGVYGFDRWLQPYAADGTVTYSAQTFTTGAAPVAGYEARNFCSIQCSGQTLTSAASIFGQYIEDVRTLAGQTATVSFWAKAASGTPKVAVEFDQRFGSGGSPSSPVMTYVGQVTLSTSWARYTVTGIVPSLSGKTIGTTANTSFLSLNFWTSAGSDFNARTGSIGIQNNTVSFWGVQLEAGSVATPFQTATGTIQGELAACQRYYYRTGVGTGNTTPQPYEPLGYGSFTATTNFQGQVEFPVSMRIATNTVEFSNVGFNDASSIIAATNVLVNQGGTKTSNLTMTVASGGTQFRFARIINNNNTAGYLAWSAEL